MKASRPDLKVRAIPGKRLLRFAQPLLGLIVVGRLKISPCYIMSKLLDWLIRLIVIGFYLPVFLICVWFIILFSIEPYITYKLTSLKYPNSQLVDAESGGGSGGEWKKRIYRTNDSVDKVIVFYEQILPAFKETKMQFKPSPVYHNSYDSWLYKLALYEYYGGITIYPDPNDKSATLIEIDMGYFEH